MPKYTLIAFTSPVDGLEAEYNEWYNALHLPEAVRLKGVVSAQRFRLASLPEEDEFRYMTLMELDVDDPEAYVTTLEEAAATGHFTEIDPSPIDRTKSVRRIYEPIGERLVVNSD